MGRLTSRNFSVQLTRITSIKAFTMLKDQFVKEEVNYAVGVSDVDDVVNIEVGFKLHHSAEPEKVIDAINRSLERTGVIQRKFGLDAKVVKVLTILYHPESMWQVIFYIQAKI